MQATIDNADHALRAGMFARVNVLLPQKNPTLFIPATSVSYAPYGNSVYVIEKKEDEKTKKESLAIRQQFIRTGETRGDFVAVTRRAERRTGSSEPGRLQVTQRHERGGRQHSRSETG